MESNISEDKELINALLKIEDRILAASSSDPRIELYKMIICRHFQCINVLQSIQNYKELERLLTKSLIQWPELSLGEAFCLDEELAVNCFHQIEKFNLDKSNYHVIEYVFEYLTTQNSKGAKGQFFTPRYIIDEIIKPIDYNNSNLVIADPACGSGGFLNSIAKKASKDCQFYGFDFDPFAIQTAKVLSTIMNEKISFTQIDSLNKPNNNMFENTQLSIEELMKVKNKNFNGFDIIATNPPFGGIITNNEMLKNYSICDSSKATRDILFIERCYDLLKDGGKLIIVLPTNIFSDDSFGIQRKWILQHFTVNSVLSLHRDSFLPHTHQKTSVIFAEKKHGKEIDSTKKIKFIISENSGKDSRGRLVIVDGKINTDLSEAVSFIAM